METALGGMKHGFEKKSRERSEDLMTEYMHLSPEHANLLYRLVRCGTAHEGVPKPGIRFFVCDERVDPGTYLYKGQDGLIWLNVSEFARQYLAAVGEIAQRPVDHLSHVPLAEPAPRNLRACAGVEKSIDDFCDLVAGRINAKVEHGEIHASASPFFPESLLGPTVKPAY